MKNKVEKKQNARTPHNATHNQLQEIYFSETQQVFYTNTNHELHALPPHFKQLLVCSNSLFTAFLEYLTPFCVPVKRAFTFENLAHKLNDFLTERTNELDANKVEIKTVA